MKTICFTILIIKSVSLAFGQSHNAVLVKESDPYPIGNDGYVRDMMKDASISSILWPDTINAHQKRLHDTGFLEIEYEVLHDSIKLRKEFDEHGNFVKSSEIYQQWAQHLRYVEDPMTGEKVPVTKEGYVDVLHGQYHYPGKRLHGQFVNAIPVGEWTMLAMDEGNVFIVLNFNENGSVEGDYCKYYGTGWDVQSRDRPKLKGEYKVLPQDSENISDNTIINDFWYYSAFRIQSVRNGVWRHYNEEGELIQVVTYEWMKK